MITAGVVAAALAAVLHVYIFVLESFRWTAPRTRAAFGTTLEEAEATKLLAYNQGFYNFFLAIVTGVGVGLMTSDGTAGAGLALVFAGVGSMLAAALVLVTSARDKLRSAAIQGAFPLAAIVLVGIGLVTG